MYVTHRDCFNWGRSGGRSTIPLQCGEKCRKVWETWGKLDKSWKNVGKS